MLATPNSCSKHRGKTRFAPAIRAAALALVMGCLTQGAFGQTNAISNAITPIQYANLVYSTSLERYRADSTNIDAAWRFGAACFELAEFSTNDTQRATLAVEGINAMRNLILLEANSAPAHYYLAMNLGQLARTKTLGALKIVGEMEDEFKTAAALDEQFDHAGPDRNLGQLYFRAPGWPASIGNRSKARKHLERAARLSPEYPGNHLTLLEASIDWRDKKGIARETQVLEALMTTARTNLTGIAWESSWTSWDARWQTLKQKTAKALTP